MPLRRFSYQREPDLLRDTRASRFPTFAVGHTSLLKGAEAAVEFHKILDHRGTQIGSPLYSLAQLGLARAAVLQRDTAKARKAYEDFFAFWESC